MNDKKQLILEAALRLFAAKGFHSTSIQDIVEEVGIAKGSVYLHFKSKEDILVSAIKHMVSGMIEEIGNADAGEQLTPKEKLVRKLERQFEFSLKHKAFIFMLMDEGLVHVNEEMKTYLYDLRKRSVRWAEADIVSVYGDRVGPYALDAAAVLQAMTSHYTGILMLDDSGLDLRALARFIADRLNDAVEGMLAQGRPPLLSERSLFGEAGGQPYGAAEERFRYEALFREARGAVQRSGLDDDERRKWDSYLIVLEHELRKPQADEPVVGGLLAHLRGSDIEGVAALAHRLSQERAEG
ncbi:TetR/AcrR family transcriptional regulator [Paenibacillus sp.]|uniref:TetR/AcrR family transcriptional regulator n=1 Tax=Paenibacillus sp. TaxID=58172 RepID=UPI002D5F658D|nr:TetR/AcrR family transcriptional regulator [Paenibacillus sp.]HZG83548.1 TetR/AcrR family transcriptional regulator [Paenibacillus sp.]